MIGPLDADARGNRTRCGNFVRGTAKKAAAVPAPSPPPDVGVGVEDAWPLLYTRRPMTAFATTTAVILAAGQGTRMKSATPKVLHTIAGRPLVHYPVEAALEAGCGEVVVVVGHGREEVAAYLAKAFGARVKTAVQEHAARHGGRGARGQ